MATFEQTFDATQVEPDQPFEPIPAGKYKIQIIASEVKTTKRGDGTYLELQAEVLDGELSGRRIWDRLNLTNPNAEAVAISQRRLSALCRAAGVLRVSDSEQLHYHPVLAVVKVRAAHGEHGPSNDVAGYGPLDGTAATQPATPAQAVKAARPWKRAKAADLDLKELLNDDVPF